MELDVLVTPDDFVSAIRLHSRPFTGRAIVLLGVAVALSMLLLAVMGGGSDTGFLFVTPVFILVAGALVMWAVIMPDQGRKLYWQNKAVQSPQHLSISEAGIRVKNEFGEAMFPWDHFRRWKEGKTVLVVYQTDNQLLVIPKRWVKEEASQEQLRQFLSEGIVPAS